MRAPAHQARPDQHTNVQRTAVCSGSSAGCLIVRKAPRNGLSMPSQASDRENRFPGGSIRAARTRNVRSQYCLLSINYKQLCTVPVACTCIERLYSTRPVPDYRAAGHWSLTSHPDAPRAHGHPLRLLSSPGVGPAGCWLLGAGLLLTQLSIPLLPDP